MAFVNVDNGEAGSIAERMLIVSCFQSDGAHALREGAIVNVYQV
jgi:hypothetical protein